ncbi:MAG TPA: mannose-6-phosphate isomerase, class I, partial [Chitinophaga sp.]
ERIYSSPAPDFVVSQLKLQPGVIYENTAKAAEIMLVLNGSAVISGSDTLDLQKGQSVFVAAGETYKIEGEALLYKATVPV